MPGSIFSSFDGSAVWAPDMYSLTNTIPNLATPAIVGTRTGAVTGFGAYLPYWILDSVDDKFLFGSDAALNMGSGQDFTVSALVWMAQSCPASAAIMGKYDLADTSGWFLAHESGGKLGVTIRQASGDGSVTVTDTTARRQQWVHAVAVFRRSAQVDLYINGVLVGSSVTASNWSIDNAYQLAVGLSGSAAFFGGMIALPHIWRRAFSDTDVAQYYREVQSLSIGLPSTPNLLTKAVSTLTGTGVSTYSGGTNSFADNILTVVADGTGFSGIYTIANPLVSPNTAVTASCWVRGPVSTAISIVEVDGSEVNVGTTANTFDANTEWHRMTVARVLGASAAKVRIYVRGGVNPTTGTWYARNFQVEYGSEATPWQAGF
jgi:hypothetical protein